MDMQETNVQRQRRQIRHLRTEIGELEETRVRLIRRCDAQLERIEELRAENAEFKAKFNLAESA